MSEIFLNQNNLLQIGNNDIEMKEPNAYQNESNFIINIERKQLKCNLDPNIAQEISKYINNNNQISSKLRYQDQTMNSIVANINDLNRYLYRLFNDCNEKFIQIEEKINTDNENNKKVLNLIKEDIKILYGNLKSFEKEYKDLIEKLRNEFNKIEENLKILNVKQNENEEIKEKMKKIEGILNQNNIKLENVELNKKEYKDIEIKKYAKNLNEKVLKFKIFQKNNIIFFDEITKDCAENEEKEKELADKYKIIFKRDENNEKGIIYEI